MKITFVHAGDWEAMYADGLLVYQGHQIEYDNLMSRLNELGALANHVSFEDIPAGDLVFRLHDGRLPGTIDELQTCRLGTYHHITDRVVDMYQDGKLVKSVDRETYDLIKGTGHVAGSSK